MDIQATAVYNLYDGKLTRVVGRKVVIMRNAIGCMPCSYKWVRAITADTFGLGM